MTLTSPEIPLNTLQDYRNLMGTIHKMRPSEQERLFRHLMRTDLFFLMSAGLGRKDICHPWLLERCKEVQAAPNDHIDIWSRGHYKSSIITFGLTIQDVLSSHGDNPDPKWEGRELTFGIFSCTRPTAKQFLSQIKSEFETNSLLRQYFPDIMWESPSREASSWSLEGGIVFKRKGNPKENTIEAWGVIETQPTGKHFDVSIYDDVVTPESVRSPGMMQKTQAQWEMSLNMGTTLQPPIRRYIGTRYHFNDVYRLIIDRGAATPRIHPCTDDGKITGKPVLLTRDDINSKRRAMAEYTFNSQMLCNPSADAKDGFKKDWLNFHDADNHRGLNIYILVDPANEKKKSSDFTVMQVIGLGSDENYYLLDITRDRLSLTERCAELFYLHRKYRPRGVGYEKYGMQADIAHIKDTMRRTNYNFQITELGGSTPKVDRIRRLIPIFEQGRMWIPNTCHKTNYEKRTVDLIDAFINEEYLNFPVALHDDMLDALARILDEDMNLIWPKRVVSRDGDYDDSESVGGGSSWSA